MDSVTTYEAIIYSSLLVPAVLPLFIAVLFCCSTCCKVCMCCKLKSKHPVLAQASSCCKMCWGEWGPEHLILPLSPRFTIYFAKALKHLGMGEFKFAENEDEDDSEREQEDDLFTNITIYGLRIPHTNQSAMLMSIIILIYNMISLFIYYATVTKTNVSLACISGSDNCFWTNTTTGLGISDTMKINCSDEDFISDIASEDVLCLGSVDIIRGLTALAGLVALIKTANGIYLLLAVKVASKVVLRLFQSAKIATWCIAIFTVHLHSILMYGVFVALIIFGLSQQIALNTRIEWLAVLSTLFGVFTVPWYNLRFLEHVTWDMDPD